MTPQQQQIVDLALGVPHDQWVSFGDIADAMNDLGYGCTARNVSNALHKFSDGYREGGISQERWDEMNIWGKVRNSAGYVVWAAQGTHNPRGARVIHDPRNPSNVVWVAAGGRVAADGSAVPSLRFPLAQTVRSDPGSYHRVGPPRAASKATPGGQRRTGTRVSRPVEAKVERCPICSDVLVDGECAHGCTSTG